ncbi:hypothetical protein BsWGS_02685 [Bradybaena similaris]
MNILKFCNMNILKFCKTTANYKGTAITLGPEHKGVKGERLNLAHLKFIKLVLNVGSMHLFLQLAFFFSTKNHGATFPTDLICCSKGLTKQWKRRDDGDTR